MTLLESQQTAEPPSADRIAMVLRQVARAVALPMIVAISLLTFPNAIPWIIAGIWLPLHTAFALHGRLGWVPLFGCVAILLVKGIAWLPGVILLGMAMLAVGTMGLVGLRKAGPAWPKRYARLAALALWIAWAVMVIDWHTAARCSRRPPLDRTRPVVCLGDSITVGVAPQGGYPRVLQKLVSVRVINLGQEGITSADALKRLPAVLAANPQAVVVELGGHDFLKGHPKASVRANLEQIIKTCRQIGAEVVLMEIPRGFISDAYGGLERELARHYDLELVPDTPLRRLVLFSPHAPPGMWMSPNEHLSDDGLHPNARGNEVLADAVAEALGRLFGPEVLRPRKG
jgi:lysophospholipase L1-like esterase